MFVKIPANEVNFSTIDKMGIQIPGYKHYVRNYPQIDLGWKIKPWFKIDLEELKNWYSELERNYGDWKFIQGVHTYMWENNPSDPSGITGHKLLDDTSWYNLCWNPNNKTGGVPPERSNTKPEYRELNDIDDLCPRECFNGYALEVCRKIEETARIKKVVISILTPGTILVKHQDAPDKIRFHICISTNDDAYWIIDGERIQIPADGWVYLVNTSLPHELYNNGSTPIIKLYGKIFTEDVIKLGLI
jgi:hypothetical protein